MNRWGVIAGIAALTAGGAALRAIFLRYPYIDSDQAVIGLMGIRILRGEFPIYFWGEPYSGTLESFVAALTFFLFGVSRLTLNVVPFLFSLIFLLLTWRLGLVIFDRLTGLLGLALAAFPPMLLTWHSVLARGNYIENLVLGNLLLLLTLKLARPDLRPAAHCRALLVYGSVLGFAWYMSFQSVHYLIVSVLFLLWRGRRSLLLRQSWIGLLAAMVGSLPFWVHNLTTGFSSFGAIRWYARGAFPLDAFTLFVSVKLPVFLGASGFPYNFERLVTRQVPFLEWVIPGLYTASFLLALGMFVRGKVARLSKGWRGVEILLLLPLVVAGVTVGGGFGAGGDARYLLPIYTSAPLLLGGLVAALARRSRPLGGVVLGVVLFSNLYGHLTTAEGLPRYQVHLENDRALFAYMKEHGLRHASAPEYWFSYRFTFDAEESIIFATPFWREYPRYLSKYPPYTRLVNQAMPSAYVLWSVAGPIERTLQADGIPYDRVVIGRLTLLHRFSPPSSPGRSLTSGGWRLVGGTGRETFDRDLTTGWRGAPNEPLTIDLGESSTLLRISLYLGEESLRLPHGLQVLASVNGNDWTLLISTDPLVPGFAWMGNRLILEEHGRVGLSFRPVAARYLKIQLAPGPQPGRWGINELFVYTEGEEAPVPLLSWRGLYAEDPGIVTQTLLE
ncbi:MAG: glycosyltransferase family 39 protein, partial [Candidatus Rokubacteria bacterium]|nr:glycosyltransferase family 39 protein [Candidatus Rokubacteria bacterium]